MRLLALFAAALPVGQTGVAIARRLVAAGARRGLAVEGARH
jgi:hypothetical protein